VANQSVWMTTVLGQIPLSGPLAIDADDASDEPEDEQVVLTPITASGRASPRRDMRMTGSFW
jgi:hypothetical protein